MYRFVYLLHMLGIFTVFLAPWCHPQYLILTPLVELQWIYLNNQCLCTHIERAVHPNHKSLFGRIRTEPRVLLWANFAACTIRHRASTRLHVSKAPSTQL